MSYMTTVDEVNHIKEPKLHWLRRYIVQMREKESITSIDWNIHPYILPTVEENLE